MSRKSIVARAAVLAVYLFAYFGLVAEWVANLLGFTGINRFVVNFMFWGPTAIGLWFAMGRARRIGLREKAGEIYDMAKRHQIKPSPRSTSAPVASGEGAPAGAGAVQAPGNSNRQRLPDASRLATEEVEDLGLSKVVIRQTIYGKATVYLKNFKVEETVQDSVEIRKQE